MQKISFRRAETADLPDIVALLADDRLGRERESPSLPLHPGYTEAFAAIQLDPNQVLAVAIADGRVAGTLQLSFMPGLSLRGALRAEIEGVRVASALRGQGIGRRMLEWAIAECRTRGCGLVQLTTNSARIDAQRFYAGLGFNPSHIGFKLSL